MGRHPSSTQYITPIKSDGTLAVAGSDATLGSSNRGVYTLALSTTYFFPIGIQDAEHTHMQLQGDAAIVLTSATVEDSDLAPSEASDYSDNAGEWLATPAALIESAAEGAGWTQTSDVLAVAGGAAGGASWNVVNYGARRMRLKVVVGGTGGEVRLSMWSKE